MQQAGHRSENPHFSPHAFQRTFVGDLLDASADIVTVKGLAGHASIQTTARYDRRGQERLQSVMELLNTPYGGRRS
ncbi:MAG: tyrosine-type recombinase/integrase [Anaerolineae bacterium]|nr:MAG: tyrosine-type recombinase/integrase [Anaerolineae bacterium]